SPPRGGVGAGAPAVSLPLRPQDRGADTSTPNPLPARGSGRVILLQGCVDPAMAPSIREAAIRLVARAGYEVVLADGEGCCGALSEHLGRADEAAGFARTNVAAWTRSGPFDAVVTTAAGCGTTLKAYGQRLGGDAGAGLA